MMSDMEGAKDFLSFDWCDRGPGDMLSASGFREDETILWSAGSEGFTVGTAIVNFEVGGEEEERLARRRE